VNKELQKYIKTGEFTWCSRCGKIVRLGNEEFQCIKCSMEFPVDKFHLLKSEKMRHLRAIWLEKQQSKFISCFREELAEYRRKETISG